MAAISMGKLNSSNIPMDLDAFPVDDSIPPMILFFKVMYASGLYWKFIGWTQIISGGLLMTQRYAKLGAIIFFGLILNIFIITLSYNFKGTPIVPGLMLLGASYLLFWDAQSFQFLFRREGILKYENLKISNSSYWVILGILMIISIVLLYLIKMNLFIILSVIFVEGLLGLMFFFLKKKSFKIL